MRISLMVIIKLYWFLIPKHKRRKCLFKKSCSNYVYETAKSKGLISGLKALKFRVNNCNSNYNILEIDSQKILITKTNKIIKEDSINESILVNL